jgi:tetratricopeptide (TPR) repeat protein
MKIKKKKKTLFSILLGLALLTVMRIAFNEVIHLIPAYLVSAQLNPANPPSTDPAPGFSLGAATSPTQFPQGEPAAQQDPRYDSGIAAYKAKHYSQAEQLLKQALANQPNPNAEFYLGMAYTHQEQYAQAKRAFELVLAMVSPEQALAVKTRNNMLYVVKQQMLMAGNGSKANQVLNAALSPASTPNYLAYILMNGKVVHYNPQHMPLKIYISDGAGIPGWRPELNESIIYAMQTWQAATHSLLSFNTVTDPANADIIVRWRTHFSDGILGLSPMQTFRNTITESDVNLAAYYPDSKVPITMDELKGIAVHELGHAMGLQGHSPMPGDIMFPSKTHGHNQPSQRDINTITMLYQLQADVQNNSNGSTAQTQKSYYYFSLGMKAQENKQNSIAMRYYRQALLLDPNQLEAKYNLAGILADTGNRMAYARNWAGAKHNYEEATQLLNQLKDQRDAPAETPKILSMLQNNMSAVNQRMAQ